MNTIYQQRRKVGKEEKVTIKVNLKYQVQKEIHEVISKSLKKILRYKNVNIQIIRNRIKISNTEEKKIVTLGTKWSHFSKYIRDTDSIHHFKPIDTFGFEIAIFLTALEKISALQAVKNYFFYLLSKWNQKSDINSVFNILKRNILNSITLMGIELSKIDSIVIFRVPRNFAVFDLYPPEKVSNVKPLNGILGPKDIIRIASLSAQILGLTNEIHNYCNKEFSKKAILEVSKNSTWLSRTTSKDLGTSNCILMRK